MIDKLKFKNKVYCLRSISINGWGNNLSVSTEDLQRCLFDESGNYVNSRARNIDERIFFYVKKEYLMIAESNC